MIGQLKRASGTILEDNTSNHPSQPSGSTYRLDPAPLTGTSAVKEIDQQVSVGALRDAFDNTNTAASQLHSDVSKMMPGLGSAEAGMTLLDKTSSVMFWAMEDELQKIADQMFGAPAAALPTQRPHQAANDMLHGSTVPQLQGRSPQPAARPMPPPLPSGARTGGVFGARGPGAAGPRV